MNIIFNLLRNKNKENTNSDGYINAKEMRANTDDYINTGLYDENTMCYIRQFEKDIIKASKRGFSNVHYYNFHFYNKANYNALKEHFKNKGFNIELGYITRLHDYEYCNIDIDW